MIDRQIIAPLLRYVERIEDIPPTEAAELARIATPIEIPRLQYFARAGFASDRIGFVCSGWLRYFLTAQDGREFTRYFCTEDHFVSPTEGPEGSIYSVQALTDVSMISVTRDAWQLLLGRHTIWPLVTIAVQQYALRLAEERERALVMNDARTRYLDLIRQLPEIEEHVRQYYIANYLGITPEALSRIRSRR